MWVVCYSNLKNHLLTVTVLTSRHYTTQSVNKYSLSITITICPLGRPTHLSQSLEARHGGDTSWIDHLKAHRLILLFLVEPQQLAGLALCRKIYLEARTIKTGHRRRIVAQSTRCITPLVGHIVTHHFDIFGIVDMLRVVYHCVRGAHLSHTAVIVKRTKTQF